MADSRNRSGRHKTAEGQACRFVSVDVELANLCKNRCAMCPRGMITRPRGVMAESTVSALVRFLEGSRCLVTFSGMGDPLRHRGLPDVIARLRSAGHQTGVVVHPASLQNRIRGRTGMEHLLLNAPDSITVSFPSVRKEVFQKLFPDVSIESALEQVLILGKMSPSPVRVSGLLTALNPDETEEYRAFWKKYGISAWVSRCHSRGGNLGPGLVPGMDGKGPAKGGCSLFRFHSFVSWDGSLLACCHDLSGSTRMADIFTLSDYRSLESLKARLVACGAGLPFKLCSVCDEPLRNIRLPVLPVNGGRRERRKFFSGMAAFSRRR